MLGLRDLDHLAARLHGRRGRLYDGARLRALFSLGSPGDLAKTIFPAEEINTAAGLERRLIEVYVSEAREISACFVGARRALLEWQAARFQLENLKTVVRGLLSGAGPEGTGGLLIDLPAGTGYGRELAGLKSREELLAALPEGIFRASLARAFNDYPDGSVFFIEAALERDYLAELSARVAGLNGRDREAAGPLCAQETAAFNLALAARGKFVYGFGDKELLRLLAPCPERELRKIKAMLAAAGPGEAERIALGPEPSDGPAATELLGLAGLEAMSRRRYRRLAVKALRGDHLGFGTVAAYLALKRLETADLATVAEGLRLGTGAAELERRLLPGPEAAHV